MHECITYLCLSAIYLSINNLPIIFVSIEDYLLAIISL